MNWATRKIALRLTPTIIYSLENENQLKVEFQTIVKNMSQVYNVPGSTGKVSTLHKLFNTVEIPNKGL